ncbi:unnamed protein product [Phytophthora fragariaefolia]|uniref:Unnamed protein product n=1 Tax=Phytophthora fragariaefolia TaxID=1490495 RepID=A0A9W6U6K2_9STRA|nr:unnamed protein product [Phytophthora fragariaefolia]
MDNRLCIDYKLVNAITLMMEYAMPLVDELLTELDAYLWCSLDAASGFGAFLRISRVEIEAEDQRVRFSTYAEFEPTRLTKFDADRRSLAESDPMQDFIDSPAADLFNTGAPDPSSWVPVFSGDPSWTISASAVERSTSAWTPSTGFSSASPSAGSD